MMDRVKRLYVGLRFYIRFDVAASIEHLPRQATATEIQNSAFDLHTKFVLGINNTLLIVTMDDYTKDGELREV